MAKKMKVSKSDKKLINDLSKTKTIRELARVMLSYLTVEEMAKFISTYMFFKSHDAEEKALSYFLKDQFFHLLKSVALAMGDLLPDFITDREFMDLYAKLPKKLFFKKD